MKRLIIWTMAMAAGTTLAAVPITVNYVGHLSGVTSAEQETVLTEKVMLMVFRLYDKPGLGRTSDKVAPLWGRRVSVALTDGDFDLDLSDTLGVSVEDARYVSLSDAIGAAVDAGSSDLYIGLTPENDANAEIYPRQKLTAVPTAVQAAAVRTVEGDFTSTGGTFTVTGKLTVNGPTTFTENVAYGDVALGEKASVDMRAGVIVKGPLTARRVEAGNLTAAKAAVGTLETRNVGRLSVSNRLTCVGSLTWKGDANWSKTLVAAPAVGGNVQADGIVAGKIVAQQFENPIGFSTNASWSVLGSWLGVSPLPVQAQESQAFISCNPDTGAREAHTSVVGGIWEAPCDCLAYFQVHLENYSDTADASVQFYIVPSATVSDYSSRNPVGVAAIGLGSNGRMETVVPVLLRKGELVKWLGYNANENASTGRKEITHTQVTAIRYLTFNW